MVYLSQNKLNSLKSNMTQQVLSGYILSKVTQQMDIQQDDSCFQITTKLISGTALKVAVAAVAVFEIIIQCSLAIPVLHLIPLRIFTFREFSILTNQIQFSVKSIINTAIPFVEFGADQKENTDLVTESPEPSYEGSNNTNKSSNYIKKHKVLIGIASTITVFALCYYFSSVIDPQSKVPSLYAYPEKNKMSNFKEVNSTLLALPVKVTADPVVVTADPVVVTADPVVVTAEETHDLHRVKSMVLTPSENPLKKRALELKKVKSMVSHLPENLLEEERLELKRVKSTTLDLTGYSLKEGTTDPSKNRDSLVIVEYSPLYLKFAPGTLLISFISNAAFISNALSQKYKKIKEKEELRNSMTDLDQPTPYTPNRNRMKEGHVMSNIKGKNLFQNNESQL